MNNHDESMRASRSYEVAFQVGAVGCILLTLYTLLGDTLVGLTALAVWCGIILFVLPWLYIMYYKKEIHFPEWFVRGPHQ